MKRLLAGLLVTSMGMMGCGGDAAADPGDGDGSCDTRLASCPGASAPSWTAVDFQPKSPRSGESYGLKAFRGKVVLVGFLSGWCPYCRTQAALLEKMSQELADEGVTDVQIVIVNSIDAKDDQAQFVQLTSFPLFQDEDNIAVYSHHRARKDDLALYDREGTLLQFYGASSQRDLEDAATYAAVKDALKAAR